MAGDVPCFRCQSAPRAGGLYCGPCRAEVAREQAQRRWSPQCSLAVYGEAEPTVPTGQGATDVAFWKAIVREALADQVAGQVAEQLDRKMAAVRAAYARLREDVRVNGDGVDRHADALKDLEARIEEVAQLAAGRAGVGT